MHEILAYRQGRLFKGPTEETIQVEVDVPLYDSRVNYVEAFEIHASDYYSKLKAEGHVDPESEPNLQAVENPLLGTFGFIGGRWLYEAAKSAGIMMKDSRSSQKKLELIQQKMMWHRRIRNAVIIPLNPYYLGAPPKDPRVLKW